MLCSSGQDDCQRFVISRAKRGATGFPWQNLRHILPGGQSTRGQHLPLRTPVGQRAGRILRPALYRISSLDLMAAVKDSGTRLAHRESVCKQWSRPMSVSAIVPSSTLNQAYNLQVPNQQRQAEFQQLTQALQSGNLSSTQKAFGAITNASNSGLLSVQLSQDLSKLGSALQSGNPAGARQAYSSVQQSLQSPPPMAAHHHRPHHGGGGVSSLLSALSDSASSSGSSTASPDVFQPVNLTA
jgi:hypothetical protein